MPLKLEQLQTDARILLERFAFANKMAFAAGHTDIHQANDGLLVELLREVFDAPSLRNLNAEERNAAGVDLVDDKTGLAIQITGRKDLRKVIETLQKCVDHRLFEKYPRIKIFVTTQKQRTYKQAAIDRVVSNKLKFRASDDIFDSLDLAEQFQTYEFDRLHRIVTILRKHVSEDDAIRIDSCTGESQERELENSYRDLLQRSVFLGVQSEAEFRQLALSIVAGRFEGASQSLRRRVLLRAARSSAVHKNVRDAERFLELATAMSGPDSDAPARARLSEAKDDPDGAVQILRDQTDEESISTLLSVVVRAKGDDKALQWLTDSGTSIQQLTALGLVMLCQIHLRKGDIETVRTLLDPIDDARLSDCPFLLHLRGHVRLASAFPKPDQESSLSGDPLAIFLAKPILPEKLLAERLDGAIADHQQVAPTLRRLDLKEIARTAERYANWATLLHPYRRMSAIANLRSEVQDPRIAAQKIELALEFIDDFDDSHLTEFLHKREDLGGLDNQELRALVVIQLHKEDHVGIFNTISRYRVRCEEIFGRSNALAMEIRSLALNSQSASARKLLDENKDTFDHTQIARLVAQIAAAEGGDPTVELIRNFEESNAVESLRALVAALYSRSDYISLAPYAERLFGMTSDPRDIDMAAKAFAAAGDTANFARVMKSHPIIADRDPKLMRQYAWQLFQFGHFDESEELVRKLRTIPNSRDFNLEIALAVERGRWEQLAVPLSAMFEERASLPAQVLMQGALLAEVSGQGPLKDLLFAAVEKGADDAQVLVNAYSVAVEAGIDDEDNKPFEWFRRAVELSGPQGPVQQMQLKDVLARHSEWQVHSRQVNEALMNGDVPLCVAANALHAKTVDLMLGNFVRNSERVDPRQRSVIPLFSGRRMPGKVPTTRRIALDLSALLVLGWLRLLPRIFDAFESVVLPAATCLELFNGQRSVKQHQKSRLTHAEELVRLTSGKLRVIRSREFPADPLDREIGVDLAGLIRAATDMNGVVVRPSPVHKMGGELIEADMSAYSSRLADTRGLLAVLNEYGAVDQRGLALAKRYFELQDRGWEGAARPRRENPLFLDGLAVAYLQVVEMLPVVVQTFDEVYIDSGTLEEAEDLLHSRRIGEKQLEVIRFIRDCVKTADEEGKITFGPRSSRADIEEIGDIPTLHLLANISGADLVVFDDRALNKESHVSESSGRTVPIATTLDLIEELEGRGVLSRDETWSLRHQLRIAGAALIPVSSEEILAAATNSRTNESPELRSMRESMGLARVRETPRFPSEIPWFISVVRAVKDAIFSTWSKVPDEATAASISDSIYALQPQPVDWVGCWQDNVPPDWIAAVTRTIATGFALGFDIDDEAARKAYGDWADVRIFKHMRELQPRRFQAVIDQIKELILE